MQLHYLTGPNGLFAIFVKDSINGNAMHYILKDHIGSINYVIDTTGIIEEEMNFDAWGNRRNPTSWSYSAIPTNYMFDRGFTLHEHLDDFKLINMNGRVYDPVLARFLSPDPVLQMPEYSQNFNRYSYALNNPLKYTDPSGFVIEGDDELIKITNNSPIKIPDNVFTNGKAARQAAANEELFGKIKSGFGKDDRVKTELTDVAASERGAKENITYTAGPYTSWTGVIGQTAELGAKMLKTLELQLNLSGSGLQE
jgi:RHS repeat-associated protein